MSSVVHAYGALLRLFPDGFRRRYQAEMLLDFEDALRAASSGGPPSVLGFGWRALADLGVSLLREWTRVGSVMIAVATTGATLLLWGLALRPWAWDFDKQPGPPAHVQRTPVDAVELLILAVVAMIPVVVVILFAHRLVDRRDRRRHHRL